MQENSSADGLRRGPRVRPILQPAVFSAGQKILLLALNALPLAHLAGTLLVLALAPLPTPWRWAAALSSFFLLPPLLARAILAKPLRTGELAVPSGDFFRWWATWQLQGVFNRLPWIDEGLRFIPGAYSLWLRLWGAKIGRLTLWSPGVRVYDRPLLRIGADVVVGLDVRMSGHFGGLDTKGKASLTLGLINVEDRCTLGGGAFLGPGAHLERDQFTEVLFLGTPFVRWRAGARVSPSDSPSPTHSLL